MKISEKIAILRKRIGFSQEDLANELDISRQSVYKWENDNAMPDIEKIKKMAKLFNISFDKLLDDNIDITVEAVVIEKKNPAAGKKKYRDVFVSDKKLDSYRQAGLDHGYIEESKKKNKQSETIYNSRENAMREILRQYGADKIITLQNDLAGAFFQNNQNMTFGFYFNGAVRFVCPYENFISSTITNSGVEVEYKNKLSLGGVFDGDGLGGVIVGRKSQPYLRKPTQYDLQISYFDKDGKVNEYKLNLNCRRDYVYLDYKKSDEADIFLDMISDFTKSRLNEIYSKLCSLPVLGERIQSGDIEVEDIDLQGIQEKFAKDKAENSAFTKAIKQAVKTENEKRKIRNLIIVGVFFGIVALSCMIYGIVLAVEQTNIANRQRQAAQYVVELIDQIGEVTLEDKALLSQINLSFGQLNDAEKLLVNNYSVYLSAQKEFDILYDKYMEEETKDDPTRSITLEDLVGIWSNSTYDIYIDNVGGGKSVWYRTYNKKTESFSKGGALANCESSVIGGYDWSTKAKSGEIFCWNGGIFSEYLDFTIKIDSNGNYILNIPDVGIFTKNK